MDLEDNQARHDGALSEESPTSGEQAEIDRQAEEAARYEPPEETYWEHEMREDPCTDPRPDPRTHPEYWME